MIEKPYAVAIIELNKDQKRQIDGLAGFATRVMNLSQGETDKEGRFDELAARVKEEPLALYAVAERIAVSPKSAHHRLAREAIRATEFDEYLDIALERKTRAAASTVPAVPVPRQEELERKELIFRQDQLLDKIISQGQPLVRTWVRDLPQLPIGLWVIEPVGGSRVSYENWPFGVEVSLGGEMFGELCRKGIFETVVVAPYTQDVIKKRIVKKSSEVPGFLGRSKTVTNEVEEEYIDGKRNLSIREAIGLPSDEPAAVIEYGASDREDPSLPNQSRYRDGAQGAGVGRPGNRFDFKVVVPQSLAEEFSALLQTDPVFVRMIALITIDKRYAPNFNQIMNRWGRPPYEKWEKYKTPEMYFVDALSNAADAENLGRLKFDERNVIKFHTEEIDGWQFGVVE